jgi:hypothetical protein
MLALVVDEFMMNCTVEVAPSRTLTIRKRRLFKLMNVDMTPDPKCPSVTMPFAKLPVSFLRFLGSPCTTG